MAHTLTRSPLGLGLLACLFAVGCYSGADQDTATFTSASTGASAATDMTDGSETSAPTEGDSETGDEPPAEFEPASPSLRRLLARHYVNSVRDLLGPGAAAVVTPPDDTKLNGFDAIGSAQLAVSDAAVEAYEVSARAAAAEAMAGNIAQIEAYLAGCTPQAPDDQNCHGQFIQNFGLRAFRRPLEPAEQATYLEVAQTTALEGGDFFVGVEYTIAAMLQSPNFLYQVELGVPDPDDANVRRLNGYEMATRLSYFLRDTTPDRALLDAAAEGVLDTAQGVRSTAQAILAGGQTRIALSNFYSEILHLDELSSLPKDPGTYPLWSPQLAESMRRETLALIEDVIWQQDGDIRWILDTPFTFVDATLAEFYGIPHPSGGVFTEAFLKVPQLPEHKRGGIFGQGAFLALFAHISSTSPTHRGKFVRETVLCQPIPAPPPDVATDLPPAGAENPTARDRLEKHMNDEVCSTCHVLMDPIGFGLENYDGIGSFRTMENGVEINTVSEVTPYGEFDGALELGQRLRDAPGVSLCMVRKLFRHATGHVETVGEMPTLRDLDDGFVADGLRMQQLLVDLVASQTFRSVGPVEP